MFFAGYSPLYVVSLGWPKASTYIPILKRTKERMQRCGLMWIVYNCFQLCAALYSSKQLCAAVCNVCIWVQRCASVCCNVQFCAALFSCVLRCAAVCCSVQLRALLCSCLLRCAAVCCAVQLCHSCVQLYAMCAAVCSGAQLCAAVRNCVQKQLCSAVHLTYVLSKGILLIYSNIRSLSSSEDLKLVFLSPSTFSGVSILGVSGGGGTCGIERAHWTRK